ncbi:hypothetical protein FQZ97_894150 [compost metagenome]
MGDAGVVDQQVEAAEAFAAGCDELPLDLAVGDVAGHAQDPRFAQLRDPRGEAGGVQVGEQQGVATAVAGARQFPAEAAGGAGDQDHPHHCVAWTASSGAFPRPWRSSAMCALTWLR